MSSSTVRTLNYRDTRSIDEVALQALSDFGLFKRDWSECARNASTLVVRVAARKALIVQRNPRFGQITAALVTVRAQVWAARHRISLV